MAIYRILSQFPIVLFHIDTFESFCIMDLNGVLEVLAEILVSIFIIFGVFKVLKIFGIIKERFCTLRESFDQLPEIIIDMDSTLGM